MDFRTTTIALLVLTASELPASDWPQYLGPTRNAVSTETGWNTDWDIKEPALLWKEDIGAGCSGIAIVGDRLYTLGNARGKDRVLCLNALTGKKIWDYDYKEPKSDGFYEGGPSATPTVHENKVYTVSKSGKLHCLDATTGILVWTRHYQDDFGGIEQMYGWAASPLVHNNQLIVDPGGPGASIAALDLNTGKTLWQNGDEEPGYAAPVLFKIDNQRGYALFQKTALLGYTEKDGAELFRFEWRTEWDINASLPLFFDDDRKVFISSGYGSGSALIDISERVMLYRSKDLFLHFQHGIIIGDYLYAVSGDSDHSAEFKCLELATGEVKWSNPYGGSDRGNLIQVGDHLLILTERGELILATPNPGQYNELHRIQALPKTCWTPPAFSNHLLYLRNNEGELRCYDLK